MSRGGGRATLTRPMVAALRAWADIDRFELPDVPVRAASGYEAVGDLPRDEVPPVWPPVPDRAPARPDRRVLDTRVMFGCLPIADLETLLDRLFSDDRQFVQAGLGRPGGRGRGGLTCRGSFRVDQDGRLITGSLAAGGIDDSPAEFDRALRNVGVGTVHTFQGREHDAVVLVLGGATAGARQWAAGTPNLLNVAVTRARDRLYVIGDRRAWGGTGYAAVLDAHLP